MAHFAVTCMAREIAVDGKILTVNDFIGRSTSGVIGIIPVFEDFRAAMRFAGGNEDRILRVEV